jgi:glycerol-3-phosphate dehydrogenase (NAD+)
VALSLLAAVDATSLNALRLRGGETKEKVAIIGSGNWGSAIAKIIGRNLLMKEGFDPEVRMWVFEEEVEVGGETRKLTEVINGDHENVKYLPGIKFTENVIADPDVTSAVKDATMLVFVMPHQFLARTCPKITGMAPGCRAVSLIKGIEFEEEGPLLISKMIKDEMGGMDVSVLMGANVANEVAQDEFCESTVGYSDEANGAAFVRLFDCPTFRVGSINDVAGTELCGALKNVVALGAGFCDGLGLGGNTKAAIIRIGLAETAKFAKMFFDGIKDETFMESCGLADLVTTCFGGRNRKCAEAFAKGEGDWEKIEADLLNGQKLQGTITAKDVSTVLKAKGLEAEFPLFTRINAIAFEGMPASEITTF